MSRFAASFVLVLLAAAVASGQCPAGLGDANSDGDVDITDVQCSILVALWQVGADALGSPACVGGEPLAADANCDAVITVADVQLTIAFSLEVGLANAVDGDADGCPDSCQVDAPACLDSPAPFVADFADGQVIDPTRGRPIAYRAYYPVGLEGLAPVLLVSHGGSGSFSGYTSLEHLGLEFAAHGYLAIHLNHEPSVNAYTHRSDRPADVSYLLDRLEAGTLPLPPGSALTPDLSRVGHAGYSWGAYTAHAVAGAVFEQGAFADERIAAICAISPQGEDQFGSFDNGPGDNSWESVEIPSLQLIGGAELNGSAGGGVSAPQWRLRPFQRFGPHGDKFAAVLPGQNHGDMGNVGDAATEAATSKNCRLFFDVYVAETSNDGCCIGAVEALVGTSLARKFDPLTSALAACDFDTERTEWGVVTGEAEVYDPSRGDRELGVKVYLPVGPAAVHTPVLISHGGLGTDPAAAGAELADFSTLATTLAEAGFAVAVVGHRESSTNQQHRLDRPADISFLLDRFESGTDNLPPEFAGTLDVSAVAHIGHSAGAYTALAVGGATYPYGTFRDDRVRAVVALSPQGTGGFFEAYDLGGDENTWATIEVPALYMVGGDEVDTNWFGAFQADGWRRQPFERHPPTTDAMQLVFEDQNHFEMGGNDFGAPAVLAYRADFIADFLHAQLRATGSACEVGAGLDSPGIAIEFSASPASDAPSPTPMNECAP